MTHFPAILNLQVVQQTT